MKKVLLTVILTCFLVGLAGLVLAQACSDDSGCDTDMGEVCLDSDGNPCSGSSCGNNSGHCSGGSGMSTGSSTDSPGECIKLRADIEVKLMDNNGAEKKIMFKEGSIVAPRKFNEPGMCGHNTDSITTPCEDDISWDKGEACYTKAMGVIGTLGAITNFTNWLFMILMLVVVLMIIWGGFQYVTAGGVPEKAATGKQILTYAIIGLAIALLAKILPFVVKFIIGVS